MFAGMVGAYLSGTPFRFSTVEQNPDLAHKH